MQSITLLLCSFFVLTVFSQEVRESTQFTTNPTTVTQGIDWENINQQQLFNNGPQARSNNQPHRFISSPYGPVFLPLQAQPFGARLQPENRTYPAAGYISDFEDPLEAYYVNWTDNSNLYQQPSDTIRYPFSNGMLQQPPISYYPQAFSSGSTEGTNYPIPANPNANIYNPMWQDINGKINETLSSDTTFSDYIAPERSIQRQNREQESINLGYQPNPDFPQWQTNNRRRIENPVQFQPYPYPPLFLPPSLANSGEVRELYPEVNVFVRPPYVDREPGTEPQEIPSVKEVTKEQIDTPIDRISTDLSETPETFPPKFVPRRIYPVNTFPFGLPPPDLAPPYPFPPRFIPPTIPPPIVPNSALPPILRTDENLITNELNGLPVTIPENNEPESLPNLPPPPPSEDPKEVIPVPVDPSKIGGEINPAMRAYEFGFDMNDGKGTDQHRKEFSDGSGAVTGSYGYRDAFGVYRIVNYIADKNGFRAFIQSNEPGVANPGSADVTVVAEQPPPKTIAEGLSSLKLDTVDIPGEPLATADSVKK